MAMDGADLLLLRFEATIDFILKSDIGLAVIPSSGSPWARGRTSKASCAPTTGWTKCCSGPACSICSPPGVDCAAARRGAPALGVGPQRELSCAMDP